jgi:elongation factor Ts
MSLARTALAENNNDLTRALQWLESHSPADKAAKLSSRTTSEGTIAVSVLGGKRVSMIHLACETDFVAKNQVFLNTAKGIAGTAAFLDVPESDAAHPHLAQQSTAAMEGKSDPIQDFPIQALSSAPLIALPSSADASSSSSSGDQSSPTTEGESSSAPPLPEHVTVQQSLLSSLSSTGENLRLLRAISYAAPFPSNPIIRFIPGAYAHGGSGNGSEGRIGGVVVLSVVSRDTEKPMASLIHGPGGDKLEQDLSRIARDVARQVVGFPTKVVSKDQASEGVEPEEVLLDQQFMMIGEQRTVKEVMDTWGEERGVRLNVVGMRRWSVTDALESEGSVAEEA